MKFVSLHTIAPGILSALALAGCADPADKTPDAIVTESTTSAEAPATPADGTVYTISSASMVGFIGSKITGSHTGGFNTFSGTITLSGEDLTQAKIEAAVDMTSVHTDADKLTAHLMSADFFEVETYPKSTFTSTAIAKDGDNYLVTGDFTLHGVTKSITFPASISLSQGTIIATAEFDINRKDFGIVYPGMPDDAIRDNVVIKLNIDATK